MSLTPSLVFTRLVFCLQGSTSSWSGATANGNKKSVEEGDNMVSYSLSLTFSLKFVLSTIQQDWLHVYLRNFH